MRCGLGDGMGMDGMARCWVLSGGRWAVGGWLGGAKRARNGAKTRNALGQGNAARFPQLQHDREQTSASSQQGRQGRQIASRCPKSHTRPQTRMTSSSGLLPVWHSAAAMSELSECTSNKAPFGIEVRLSPCSKLVWLAEYDRSLLGRRWPIVGRTCAVRRAPPMPDWRVLRNSWARAWLERKKRQSVRARVERGSNEGRTRALGTRYWAIIMGIGHWALGTGHRTIIVGTGHWTLDTRDGHYSSWRLDPTTTGPPELDPIKQ